MLFDNLCLKNSNEKVMLGITLDNKLTLDSHIKNISRKTGQKNFMHYRQYLIFWKQTKKTYFQWNDKISIQLLSSGVDVLFKKVKQINR